MATPSQLLFEFMRERLPAQTTPSSEAMDAVARRAPACLSAAEHLPPDSSPDVQSMRLSDDAFVHTLDYDIRVSKRARQVLLRIQPGQGLVVTIPRRFAKRDVPLVLIEQREWIERNLIAMDERVPDEYKVWPPRTLNLSACGMAVTISYKDPGASSPRSRWHGTEQLSLFVDSQDRAAVTRLIANALKSRARKLLAERIYEHAKQHGFYFKKLAVRAQRSVWGSYSSSGTLSLNYKLIFLRPDLVDYVLLHELAHTRYLDHSPAFWRLVESLHPNARVLDKELNNACRYIPPWLETHR
ncbi:MAG: M48 family metallopeptidase [Granulosicoccus sp.]|nr:M48 family metallopeptidase [Granulosicoccus sp.]